MAVFILISYHLQMHSGRCILLYDEALMKTHRADGMAWHDNENSVLETFNHDRLIGLGVMLGALNE